jgi:hypothetical protein
MAVSDLDRLAQSVRRALDRIDRLEADKRRLETDNSVLEARLKEGLYPEGGLVTAPKTPPAQSPDKDRAKAKVMQILQLLKKYEGEL